MSNKEIVVTDNMRFGTSVHNYLLEPEKFNHSSVEVKKIAVKLKEKLNGVWQFLIPEYTIVADFKYSGWTMRWRGRLDLCIPNRLVVDVKIINGKSIKDTMQHFGYPNQLTGYSLGAQAKDRLICAYSRKTGDVELVQVESATEWWAEQIFINGKPD